MEGSIKLACLIRGKDGTPEMKPLTEKECKAQKGTIYRPQASAKSQEQKEASKSEAQKSPKPAPARKKSSIGRVPETNNYIARIKQAWDAGPVQELKVGTLTVRKTTQFNQIRTLDLDAFGSLLEKIQVALKNSTRYQIDKIIELLKNKGLSPEKVSGLVKAGLEGDALIKAVLEAMGEKPDALLTDAAKADEANKKAQELKQAKEAAEAKKKAAEETAAKKQQAAQLIQQLSISPLAKDEVYRNNPDLLILSGEINLGQRIIYFQEGEGNQKKEMIALIKWNEGERRWQVAGRPGYTVDNTEGKLTLKKDSGSLFKRKLEATLVVDSAWKRMKAMGVSYTDYQQIFADERVTWDEFKKIKDATREAYNFWSWGGIVNKDGDEGISASDMEMVFQNHINKVSEGLGENQKTQIIRAYVVAKYFVIVPAEQVAKKLMEGKDHLSAAELLAAVGPNLTKSTAMQVIRNIVNDPVLNGNLSFENISLNKAQVERFIATMGFLAQVEVEGYKVDTSKLKNKSALKDADNVLAWLRGDEVSESEGGGHNYSGGEVDEKLRELDKEASDVKKGNPLKHFKGDLVNNERALDIMYKYYLKKGDYANAAKYALRLPVEQAKEALGKIAEHYSSKIDGEIKAGDRDSDQTEKKKYYDRAKKLIEDFKPIIEIVKEKGKDSAALVSNINGAINSVKVPLARGYAELENPEARKTAREIVGDINDDEEVKLGGNNNSKPTLISGKEIKAEIEKMLELDPRIRRAEKLLFVENQEGQQQWKNPREELRKEAFNLLNGLIKGGEAPEAKRNAAHAKVILARAGFELAKLQWNSAAKDIIKDNEQVNNQFEQAAKLFEEAAKTFEELSKQKDVELSRKNDHKAQREQALSRIAMVAMFYNEEATLRKTAKNSSGYHTLLKKATEIAKKIPDGIKLTMFKQPTTSDLFKKQIGNTGAKQKLEKGTDATGGRGGKASGDKNKLR